MLGAHIAAVQISAESGIEVLSDRGRHRHRSIKGDPLELLRNVIYVVPLEVDG
jgi:hypothetical protein